MIKKNIYPGQPKHRLLARAKDKLYRFILADGAFRGAVLHGTHMVREMRANHGLGILETLTLGHAYLGAGLMSASFKGNDRFHLHIECSGPIGGLDVEANAFGEVRGFLKRVPIPIEKPLDDFNLSPFFGAGFLEVTRHLEDAKQPFSGRVILRYGSVAKDLAYYYLTSEQIPTAFDLSVKFDSSGEVAGAGGLFLQAMPDAPEDAVAYLENAFENLPSIGTAFSRGQAPEKLVRLAFRELAPKFLANHRVEFMCHCGREQSLNLIRMLPFSDLEDIRANGPFPLDMRCHHCGSTYPFSRAEIEEIFAERFPNN